jgi:hypothetical protein
MMLGIVECFCFLAVGAFIRLSIIRASALRLEGHLSPVEGVRVVEGDLDVCFTESADTELPLV